MGRGPVLANFTSSTEMRHPPTLSLPTLKFGHEQHFHFQIFFFFEIASDKKSGREMVIGLVLFYSTVELPSSCYEVFSLTQA